MTCAELERGEQQYSRCNEYLATYHCRARHHRVIERACAHHCIKAVGPSPPSSTCSTSNCIRNGRNPYCTLSNPDMWQVCGLNVPGDFVVKGGGDSVPADIPWQNTLPVIVTQRHVTARSHGQKKATYICSRGINRAFAPPSLGEIKESAEMAQGSHVRNNTPEHFML